MLLPRIIPVLLFRDNGLYKTIKFRNPKYVGDPLNAVKVFNQKEVDELIILDYKATIEHRPPSYILIGNIASQCFMPVCYGGGIRSVEDIKIIINLGVEKIALNTIAVENPAFIEKAATLFGSSTIVVSVDVKKSGFGNYVVYTRSGSKPLKVSLEILAKRIEECGAGEILINSITRDGSMQGYDNELIKIVAKAVKIPVIACGGVGVLTHFREAYENGASAMAAGSFFVFHGKHRGVLISYPSQNDLLQLFKNQE
jgi:imidazole glycerol-phosphate synthase subunit HisF